MPAGVTVQKLEWPYTTGNTVPETNDGTVRAALTLKTDGTRPFLVGVSEYKHLTVNGDRVCQYMRNGSNNYVTDGSTVKVGNIDLPVKSKGVEVSGTITSYGDAGENVTVQLIEAGHTEPSYEDIVPGNSAPYSFETVLAGDYTLKVMKKGHAPFTKEITVGNSNVTENVTIYLIGDVNKDGKIDADDVTALLRHVSGIEMLSSSAVALGNVNGDSNIDADDVTKLLRYVSGIIPNLN